MSNPPPTYLVSPEEKRLPDQAKWIHSTGVELFENRRHGCQVNPLATHRARGPIYRGQVPSGPRGGARLSKAGDPGIIQPESRMGTQPLPPFYQPYDPLHSLDLPWELEIQEKPMKLFVYRCQVFQKQRMGTIILILSSLISLQVEAYPLCVSAPCSLCWIMYHVAYTTM